MATVSRGFVLLAVLALAFPAESLAAHAGSNYCGVDIPDDEAFGFVQLPHGDVFCPLLADPKSSGSFASWQRVASDVAFGLDIAG